MRMLAACLFLAVSLPAIGQTARPAAPAGAPAQGFQPPPRADAPPAAPAQAVVTDRSSLELKKTAKAGRDVYIGSYITLDKTCKVGATPKIDITEQPKTGVVRVRPHAVVLMTAPGVQRNKCLGTSPAGIALWYRGNAKARGDDVFSYAVSYPDGRLRDVKATVTVQ